MIFPFDENKQWKRVFVQLEKFLKGRRFNVKIFKPLNLRERVAIYVKS